MKIILKAAALFLGLAAPLCLQAQHSIKGRISDAATGSILPGASITLDSLEAAKVTISNAEGNFEFGNVSHGAHKLSISFVGFAPKVFRIDAESHDADKLGISLEAVALKTDEVMVTSTRAAKNVPVAFTNLDKKEIQSRNLGQDLPYLLQFTPSVVVTSDAGNGIGYSGIRVRGSDASRTNVTINGIPYNDAESQQTYFVDVPDLASSLQSVQIQRGVGTSTNGAGALGATINLQTEQQHKEAYAETNNSFGSFNSQKNTLKLGSGLINGHFAFDGRLSRVKSDGYIDRSGSDLKSFYTAGTYYGKKSMLKLVIFGGQEITHQAWAGISADDLAGNRRFNPYDYHNQVDNYTQTNYQLHYNNSLSDKWDLNAALYFTRGFGYYEEYKHDQKFADYNLPNVNIAVDSFTNKTITTSDLIRRRWLDNGFGGLTFSAIRKTENLTLTFGGGANRYDGRHFGEVIWAQYNPLPSNNLRYYDEGGTKDDANVYAKAFATLGTHLSVFADVQYRYVRHQIGGVTALNQAGDVAVVSVDRKNNFFNPKAGFSVPVGPGLFYASYALGSKEPTRQDYITGYLNGNQAPKAETLHDIEGGWRFGNPVFTGGFNLYYMRYQNQLVSNGGLDINGDNLRINVPVSYRTGIELEAGLKLSHWAQWNANLTLSRNRLDTYTESLNNYDDNTLVTTVHKNTPLSFSPSAVAGSKFMVYPFKGFTAGFLTKYVGKQYMDLSGAEEATLKAYFVHDLQFSYAFTTSLVKEVSLNLLVNNVFNNLYVSNGWNARYYYGGTLYNENGYYPQAGTNIMAGVNLKF
ncbi:MAG: TonB-dependent receptor [Bacteroidota bacterium]